MKLPWVRSQCRLPPEVDDWLKSSARDNERSKNAQLVSVVRFAMWLEAQGYAPEVLKARGVTAAIIEAPTSQALKGSRAHT